jgi:hypothetical protein
MVEEVVRWLNRLPLRYPVSSVSPEFCSVCVRIDCCGTEEE